MRRAADVRVFAGEERAEEEREGKREVHEALIYDPTSPSYRLAPFVPYPCVVPSNSSSRRYSRALWEQEKRDLSRIRRSDDPNANIREAAQASLELVEALHAASAIQIERSLAGMQQDVRDRVEKKLIFSAFTKAYSVEIKPDISQTIYTHLAPLFTITGIAYDGEL
jgi:hypothetical protein